MKHKNVLFHTKISIQPDVNEMAGVFFLSMAGVINDYF